MKTASSSVELNYAKHFMGEDDVLSKMEEGAELEQNNTGWFNPIPEILDQSYTLYNTAFQFYHQFKYGPHQSARVIKHRVSRKVWQTYFKFTIERNPFDKMVSMYYMNWGKKGIDRPGKTFEDWVQRGQNIPLNYPLYTWKNNVIVDEIIKYESLEDDLKRVYRKLGVPFTGLAERAKGNYRSGGDYQALHTDYTRQYTEKVFANELKLMDYAF